MKLLLSLAIILLSAAIAGAQPFPLPDGPPGSSITTIDQQGRSYTTFKGQTGWTTYTPNGTRYDSFPTHTGGTVTYGPGNEKWETIPSPASAFPTKRR